MAEANNQTMAAADNGTISACLASLSISTDACFQSAGGVFEGLGIATVVSSLITVLQLVPLMAWLMLLYASTLLPVVTSAMMLMSWSFALRAVNERDPLGVGGVGEGWASLGLLFVTAVFHDASNLPIGVGVVAFIYISSFTSCGTSLPASLTVVGVALQLLCTLLSVSLGASIRRSAINRILKAHVPSQWLRYLVLKTTEFHRRVIRITIAGASRAFFSVDVMTLAVLVGESGDKRNLDELGAAGLLPPGTNLRRSKIALSTVMTTLVSAATLVVEVVFFANAERGDKKLRCLNHLRRVTHGSLLAVAAAVVLVGVVSLLFDYMNCSAVSEALKTGNKSVCVNVWEMPQDRRMLRTALEVTVSSLSGRRCAQRDITLLEHRATVYTADITSAACLDLVKNLAEDFAALQACVVLRGDLVEEEAFHRVLVWLISGWIDENVDGATDEYATWRAQSVLHLIEFVRAFFAKQTSQTSPCEAFGLHWSKNVSAANGLHDYNTGTYYQADHKTYDRAHDETGLRQWEAFFRALKVFSKDLSVGMPPDNELQTTAGKGQSQTTLWPAVRDSIVKSSERKTLVVALVPEKLQASVQRAIGGWTPEKREVIVHFLVVEFAAGCESWQAEDGLLKCIAEKHLGFLYGESSRWRRLSDALTNRLVGEYRQKVWGQAQELTPPQWQEYKGTLGQLEAARKFLFRHVFENNNSKVPVEFENELSSWLRQQQ